MAAHVEERPQRRRFVSHDENGKLTNGRRQVRAGFDDVVGTTGVDPARTEDRVELALVMRRVGVPVAGQGTGTFERCAEQVGGEVAGQIAGAVGHGLSSRRTCLLTDESVYCNLSGGDVGPQ